MLFGQFKKVTFDSKEGKQPHLGPGAQSDLLPQGMPGDGRAPQPAQRSEARWTRGQRRVSPSETHGYSFLFSESHSGFCRKAAEPLTQQRNKQR